MFQCVCGNSFPESTDLARHIQQCPKAKKRREDLLPIVIKKDREGMVASKIAKEVGVPRTTIRKWLEREKRRERTPIPTEKGLMMKQLLKEMKEATWWREAIKSGLFAEAMEHFVGRLFERISALQEENKTLTSENAKLLARNKELSQQVNTLTIEHNANQKRREQELLEKAKGALGTPGEGTLVG